MAKKTITLAKELEFNTENEYFDYMIDSHVNGNFTQCRNLFNAMKKEDRKIFIMYISDREELKAIRNFYFELL